MKGRVPFKNRMSLMRKIIAIAVMFGGWMLATGDARAEDAAPASACQDPAYHALDFWIGRWRGLFLPSGRVQEGFGVHRYDAATKRWRHAWTDETPATRDLSGRQDGEAIVYDESPDPRPYRTRMTLRPLDGGRVEQKGERWDEASKSWQVTFHLIYIPE